MPFGTMLAANLIAAASRRPLAKRALTVAARVSSSSSSSSCSVLSAEGYSSDGERCNFVHVSHAGPIAAAAAAAAIATVSIAAGTDTTAQCESSTETAEKLDVNEPARYSRCLAYHKALHHQYKHRWNWENEGSRLPTTSWPTNIPDDDDVQPLAADLRYCRRSPNYRNDEDYCDALRFRIGSYWLLQSNEEAQKRGLKVIRDLAERGHPDGMCMYGMCLNEGRAGLDPNPQQAVVWFRLCSNMHFHAQALYELGVALYTGEGAAEDEAAAAKMFRRAADTGQPAAAYMLGDCLLDGVGVVRDRAEALEWLVTAAELGHRGARSRVLALLEMQEGDDYGKFTDASRQTLVDAVKEGDKSSSVDLMISSTEPKSPEERDQIEGRFQNKQATFERRYTIGGGARNPVVLARRKTIIKESRDAA